MQKINESYLNTVEENFNLNDFLGDWINDGASLYEKFNTAQPFKHIIINDFLKKEYIDEIHDLFPTNFEEWHKYYNPIEVKYANDDIDSLPKQIKDLFYLLSSKKIINVISKMTGINDLEYDPYLHGAGLHAHPRYGRLNMHLDYEKHPITSKERRLNIILYLNKEWDQSWNGQTELWDKDMKECCVKSPIKYNTAIIFQTNDYSWHGVPEIILCPEGTHRKSFAYYYVSPMRTIKNDNEYRMKAKFIKRPCDEYDPRMEKLYEIRANRRITEKDLEEFFGDFTPKNAC